MWGWAMLPQSGICSTGWGIVLNSAPHRAIATRATAISSPGSAPLTRESGDCGIPGGSIILALPSSTHLLGICLGMQLLGESSEEGDARGPWSHARPIRAVHCLIATNSAHGVEPRAPGRERPDLRPRPARNSATTSRTPIVRCATTPRWRSGERHTVVEFTSAYRSANTRGVQFHPEKSHRFGMSLLSRWAELPCCASG